MPGRASGLPARASGPLQTHRRAPVGLCLSDGAAFPLTGGKSLALHLSDHANAIRRPVKLADRLLAKLSAGFTEKTGGNGRKACSWAGAFGILEANALPGRF